MLNTIRASLLVAVLAAGTIGLSAASAQTTSPAQILGIWETEDGSLKFEMFDAGGSFAGRMIYGNRLVEADGRTFKKDTRNPDAKLRSRSLQGIVFLKSLKWDASDRRWEGGSLYDGSSGRTYSIHATLVNGKMALRGYIGSPVLGQTSILRRVAN